MFIGNQWNVEISYKTFKLICINELHFKFISIIK
jgi:hypothetical protein